MKEGEIVQEWQENYIRNMQEILEIRPLFGTERKDFETWYAEHLRTNERIRLLRDENNRLLSTCLFPALDTIFSAGEDEITALTDFGDRLMDWKTNLDCGVYVAIHDAMLSMNRMRKNRAGVIRELYKLGMGLYYLYHNALGIECREAESMHFHNEMLFTEAGSYFRYFGSISDDETRAYILRAMANISICSNSFKRRIDNSIRFIRVVKSPEYRAIAPGLPWDVYLGRAHQQLSSCRAQIASSEITQAETAAVMDSCYEVFKPETRAAKPSVRWLWPYYDMEYNCGYVSLETTVERLEKLIADAPEDEFDVSGLYAGIQLPISLGRMIKNNRKLQDNPDHIRTLGQAYRKMMRILMALPPSRCDENFLHILIMVVTDFYEVEGLLSYRELTARLMERFAGRLYLQSLKTGDLLACVCDYIWKREPVFFNGLPPLENHRDPEKRREALLDFARGCGLYHDFGRFKMSMERTQQSRALFENEHEIYQLHTVSGYQDLDRRESTREFADIARGHHSRYQGNGDFTGYIRLESEYRKMTDLTALVSDLLEHEQEGVSGWAGSLRNDGRFSPRAAAYLMNKELHPALETILREKEKDRCRAAYRFFYNDPEPDK